MAVGREDSRGQALGGLIARFTADRDAMLAQIHACQERVQDLVGRLGEHGLPMGGPSPASSPERLDELETAIALLREEVTSVTDDGQRSARDLRGLVEAVRTTAAQAMDRADRASADVDAVLERLGVEIARLETDRGAGDEIASLRAAVERLAAGGAAPNDAADPTVVETALAALRDDVRRLAGVVDTLGTTQAQWEATFAAGAARGASLADAVARLTASQEDVDAAVARLAAEQVDVVATLARLDTGAAEAALATTRRELEAALAAVVAGQRPLADGVDELQQSHGALRAQLERLREVVEGLTGWAGSAVPREALDVLEAGASEVGSRVHALESERDALRGELRELVEAADRLRHDAAAAHAEAAGARQDAACARQSATEAAEAVAGVREQLREAAQVAEVATRTASEARDASEADRRRIEDLARREIAALRAALEGGLAGLGTRLDDATRDVAALEEARDRLRVELAAAVDVAQRAQARAAVAIDAERVNGVDARVRRLHETYAALDERLRAMEDAMTRVVATRERVGMAVWWDAAGALWAQVSALVATPIIDIRDTVWQLARAASSAAKSW